MSPFDHDSSYTGTSGSLPGDPASCSVLGSLNLHLYRDLTLLGLPRPLYSTFTEEVALEAKVELDSQLSLSRSGLSQRQEVHGLGPGPPLLTTYHLPTAPEDSEVSSQCPSASGSSGSDSSCVSGQALGRGLEDLSYVSALLPYNHQPLRSPAWAYGCLSLDGNGGGWARAIPQRPDLDPVGGK